MADKEGADSGNEWSQAIKRALARRFGKGNAENEMKDKNNLGDIANSPMEPANNTDPSVVTKFTYVGGLAVFREAAINERVERVVQVVGKQA